MKTIKKAIAVILTVLMAISMMPFTAFAAVQCPECGSTDVEQIYGSQYKCNECSEWFDYTPSGPPCPECGSTNTLQMSGNYYMCSDCSNNFKYVDPSDTVEGDGSEYDPYMVGSYSALVNLCNSFRDEWYEDYAPYVQLKADIDFSNVIMTLSYGINLNLDTYHIDCGQMETRFEGGIFTVTGSTGSYISKLRIQDYATVNLNSGTLKDVTVCNSTLVINGGSITEDFETDDYAVIEMDNGTVCEIDMDDTSELLMTGGTVENFIYLNDQSTSVISGGTIPGLTLYGSAACQVSGGTFTAVSTVVNGGTLTVSGGDFSGQYGGILNYGGAVEVTGGTFGYVTNTSGTMALKGGNYEKRPNYYNNDELGYLETYVPNGFNVEETTNYFTVVPVPVHTIIWKNWDDTILETDAEVEEGETPTYDGETPTKAEDETNTYTFSGWNPTVSAVTGEATYVAQFTQAAKFSVFVKKLTGGTITVSNVTGLTTVAQLKDLLVTETGVPASAMRLIFAGKQLADDKTLGEYNIQKESTIHLVIRTYTITWKSDENTEIDTTNVAYGETPTHAAPADYEDADYTYEFAGWTPEVTAVTGEATYVAQFTAVPKTPVLPEATVSDITNSEENTLGLDSAFKFEAPEGTTAYDDYYCDFKISFDRDLTSDDIELWGQYGNFPWTNLASEASGDAYTIEKDTNYYLLRDIVQAPMTYAQIREIGTFLCGIKSHYGAAGATINVQLVLFEDIIEVNPITLDEKEFVAPTQADNGASITVAETISENFYLDDDFYGETAYVSFTYNHNSDISETADISTDVQSMSSLDDATDGRKKFSVTQAPAQATEPIEIKVYANADDAQAGTNAIDTIDYSVYTYCRDIIENYDGEKKDEMKALAKSTLDYAAAAQTYFGYNTDDMATKDAPSGFYNDVANADLSNVAGVSAAPSCIKKASLVVKSDLEINLLSDTPIDVTDFSIAATTGKDRFAVTTYQNGEYYVVHIAGIEPANMGKAITINTDKGDIVMTANSVVKMFANSNNANLSTLAKALFEYGNAANAYFG